MSVRAGFDSSGADVPDGEGFRLSVVVRARLLPDPRTMVLGRQCQGKPLVAVFL